MITKSKLVSLTLLLSCNTAMAESACALIGKIGSNVIDGTETKQLPLRLRNCEGVKVLNEGTQACYLNDTNERVCKPVNVGTVLKKRDFNRISKSTPNAFSWTVSSLRRGDPQTRIGQTRSTTQIQGFPYGNILLLDGAILFRNIFQDIGEIDKFSITPIRGEGAITFEATQIRDSITVPMGKIKRGRSYIWSATGNNFSFTGNISIASEETFEKIRNKIEQINSRNDIDGIGKELVIAEMLLEEDFRYDAEKIFQNLGLM